MLSINDNQFDGVMPSSLGLLTHLKIFRVDNNRLEGSIPMEIQSLASRGSLVSLNLTGNTFSGMINNAELCDMGSLANRSWFRHTGDLSYFDCSLDFDCSDTLCGCDCSCPENV